MRSMKVVAILISLLSLLWAVNSFAQGGMKWRGSGGWGPGSQYNRMYDPKTVETLSGEVVSVEETTSMRGMSSSGVHLVLKTDKETISVHLGPGWFIENQDTRIASGDKVEVKGSRITFEGKPAIIAAEVRKESEVLRLRDESGFPAWSGWRRR
jgi:hypothetical protein